MKERVSNKYTFNLKEKKKITILKEGESDFDNMVNMMYKFRIKVILMTSN